MDLEDLKPEDLMQVVDLYVKCIGDTKSFKSMIRVSPEAALNRLKLNQPLQFVNGDYMRVTYKPLDGFEVIIAPNRHKRDFNYFQRSELLQIPARRATNFLRGKYQGYESPIEILDSEVC
jgi:hypothetical protein